MSSLETKLVDFSVLFFNDQSNYFNYTENSLLMTLNDKQIMIYITNANCHLGTKQPIKTNQFEMTMIIYLQTT